MSAYKRRRGIHTLRTTLLAFALWSLTVWAEVLEGQVVSVADGGTITLLDGNRQQHRIRLAGIDAPEKAQPFGQRSKQHLAKLAFGKDAKADCYKIDRYDRDVCTVYVNGQDVGLAQLDAGLAWWYRKYAHEQLPRDRIDYEAAEDRATADRVGLWQDAKPVPWEWRHKRR
jgi:endonuclease YncB( thermonuclease family)